MFGLLHKTRSCTGKVRYGHQETAAQAVKSMKVKGSDYLEAYACRHCNGWHVGHAKGRFRIVFSFGREDVKE